MKKLIFILILGILAGLATNAQTSVRMNRETIGFFTLDGDTMQIIKSDDIVAGSIYVPTYSTDSVTISGCTFIIDGIESDSIVVPPGEATIRFGFNYALVDTITIESPDISWLMLLKDR